MNNKMKTGFLSIFVLLASLTLPSHSQGAEKNYLIGFRQAPSAADADFVRQSGGKIRRQLRKSKLVTAKLTDEAAAKLRLDRRVAFIEEDKTFAVIDPAPATSSSPSVTPAAVSADPEYSAAWGVDRIGSQAAHDAGFRGAGVKIAVLDTGVDYTHPELAAVVKGGDNFISLDPDFHGYWDDSWNSHGTHVAGTIAAARNGSGVVGVAPDAEIHAVKVLDGAGFGSAESIVAGIEWAIANGMHVINISAGHTDPSLALEQACRAAWEAGILVVAAAGNTPGGAVWYPAAYDTVLAVSGTEPQDKLMYWSSVGPQVELAAPGQEIYSTVAGGGYELMTGTSQAAPHVTGVAALVRSAGVTDQDGDGAVTVQDLRLRLQKTARDLAEPGRDAGTGFGLVQAAAAGGVSDPPVEQPQAISVTVTVTKAGPLADQKTATLEAGRYHVRIENSGLSALGVQVYRGTAMISAQVLRFGRKSPSTLTFDLETGAETIKVILTPAGKTGASATFSATPF